MRYAVSPRTQYRVRWTDNEQPFAELCDTRADADQLAFYLRAVVRVNGEITTESRPVLDPPCAEHWTVLHTSRCPS